MKIAAQCTHGLALRFGYEKVVRLYKEAGFDGVDVSLGDMIHEDSPFNLNGYKEYAQNIRNIADSVGIKIHQTHAPFVYPLDKWETSPALMSILKRSIEISGILGAEVEVIHPYHHPEFLGHEDEIFEKNMEYYSELLPTARANNVKIGVENMFQNDPIRKTIVHDTCSRLCEFIKYIDTLNDEYAVACLDIGHIALLYQQDQPWDFIKGLGHDRLKSLHVHDNSLISDQHQIPFQGKIDWLKVTKALGEIDYDGYFTYETLGHINACPDDFVPIHIRYMADIAKYLGALVDKARPQKN